MRAGCTSIHGHALIPLTDIAIRKAKLSDKTQRLLDGGGMYLKISPAGGKWWRLKYRFGGKEKRLSLGVCPDTDLSDARAARDDARKLLVSEMTIIANESVPENTQPDLQRAHDTASLRLTQAAAMV